jgi:hypothetical protein
LSGERGQAAVELVVAAPVVVGVALVLVQLLLAVQAQVRIEQAAGSTRSAVLRGLDPLAAARSALPATGRVEVQGQRIRLDLPVPRVLPMLGLLPDARASVSLAEPEAAR